SGLAPRRQRAEDDARVLRPKRVPAESERRELVGRMRFDDDVGPRHQVEQQIAPAWLRQVERDAALRGVVREPDERAFAIVGVAPERPPATQGIARRWLDLDDVRAEIAEELRREVARLAREIEHADAVQVAAHGTRVATRAATEVSRRGRRLL